MSAIDLIREKAVGLNHEREASDEVLALVGDARFVLIGEASHGTHEFYAQRAAITKRLIAEKNFSAVAVEADFPDAYRINRFVRGEGSDRSAEESLGEFERFPLWMWRNTEILDFVEWLKTYNDNFGINEKKGSGETSSAFGGELLERAIGVIYRPETERASHYFYARLPDQFDGVIHFDTTRALEPLDKVASWSHDDAPETFPEGI
jgi:erythromycin esterase-like protein